MPDHDDELVDRLRDPRNPRTPLFFKKLQHLKNETKYTAFRHAVSSFYRADGFLCGVSVRLGKPISKIFELYEESAQKTEPESE